MQKAKATLIDYGTGNLLSVRRGLEHVGAEVTVTSNPRDLLGASHVILPGVGAFANAMKALTELDLVDTIREIAKKGTPLLTICLGMQMLLDESEEFGVTPGLGLVPGSVIPVPAKSPSGETLKIPHIGWNEMEKGRDIQTWQGSIVADLNPHDAVYFVHSFMAVPKDSKHLLATCNYGGNAIPAIIRKDNITGCQFHPEKSGEVGLRILKRFLES